MQKFVYEYATKVYFGAGAVKEHLTQAVPDMDRMLCWLMEAVLLRKTGSMTR